jgi:FkbM family methyltransferase
VSALVHTLRRAASHAKHQWFPSPAVAAWRQACRAAAEVPRHVSGRILLDTYHVEYADLLTLCPQWHDIFVRETLKFSARTTAPRILDCGANVGLASLYFKRKYPAARITAFEADPELAAICERNLGGNGAADVKVEAAAVWREAGTVRFQREGADSGAIEGTSSGLQAAAIDVPSVRLRDRLAAERIDLLKLDIEGAELAVLSDCADVLANVNAVVMDLHEFNPEVRQTPAIMSLLADAGFRMSLSDATPLPWRDSGEQRSPFADCASSWCATLKAWRV